MSKKSPLKKSQKEERPPKLIKHGKEVQMPNELEVLNKKKADLTAQLEEVEARLAELRKEKADALMAELRALGVDLTATRPTKPVKAKGTRVCKLCGQPGHNARTCPTKKVEPAQ